MNTEPDPRSNPYIGPRAFQPGEQIYGRDVETRKLVNLLSAERIVLLHAPSGAGKTSIIQAAVIPRMRDRKFYVWPVTRLNREPVQRPPGEMYNRYVFSLLSSLEDALPETEQLPEAELSGLTLSAYRALRPRPNGVSFEVFVFDQFEELLTLNPTDQAAKHSFFAQIGELLAERNCWALFAIREDFLGALSPYVTPIPNRLDTTFRLDLLNEVAARQALQRPTQEQGVRFEDTAAQALVDDLRRVQLQRPDGTLAPHLGPYVEPVQLQVVGYRLWEILAPDVTAIGDADLAGLGDVGHALAEYYAARVAVIARESGMHERAIREWCDRQLITEQGIRGQVLRGIERSGGLANRAVQMLEHAHLVRAEHRGGATWYELTHDRLIEPIREDNAVWFIKHLSLLQRQARVWDDERRPESLLLRSKELRSAEAWAAAQPDEITDVERDLLAASQREREAVHTQARANRRLRNALIGAVLAALVALVFLIVAVLFGLQSYQQSQENQSRILAQESTRRLEQGDRELAAMLAFQAIQHYPYTADAEQALGEIARPARQVRAFSTKFSSVLAARFDDTNAHVITISDDGIIRDWDSVNGQLLHAISELDRSKKPTQIRRAMFSPNGTQLITVGSLPTSAQVWDVASGNLLDTFTRQDPLNEYMLRPMNSALFSRDGSYVVTIFKDYTVFIWEKSTHTIKSLIVQFPSIQDAAFSPDGTRMVTVNDTDSAKIWNIADGQLLTTLSGHVGIVASAQFSPDGTRIVTAGSDNTARVWDAASGQLLITLSGHTDGVSNAVFSPNGMLIVTSSSNGTMRVWEASSGNLLTTLSGHTGAVISVQFSADGARMVTDSVDGTARVWDIATGNLYSTLPPSGMFFGHIGFYVIQRLSPDGTQILTASSDGTIRVWDVASGRLRATLIGHTGVVANAQFNSDGTQILTASSDGIIRVWEVASGQLRATLSGHIGAVASAQFNPDSTRMVTISSNGTIQIWDVTSERMITTLSGHTGGVNSAIFSSDGTHIVTASQDQTARVWDVANGQLLLTLSGHTNGVNSAIFSPDGTHIVTASQDQTARVWDVASGQLLITLSGHSNRVNSAIFSPDGTHIATTSQDQTTRVWDVASGRILSTLSGHTTGVDNAIFSPDGTRIATVNSDSSVQVWDIEHSTELLNINGSSSAITLMEFTPDGAQLVISDVAGQIQIWQLWPDRQSLLAFAQSICGTCEPTYIQRVKFRLYSWHMLVTNYRQVFVSIWLGLLYLVGTGLACFALVNKPAPISMVNRHRHNHTPLVRATAQGEIFVALGLAVIAVTWMTEPIFFQTGYVRGFNRFDIITLLFTLLLNLWAGGAYSHFTRFEIEISNWKSRIRVGRKAGSISSFCSTFMVLFPFLFYWVKISPMYEMNLKDNFLAAGSLSLLVSLIAGVISNVASLIGAALYIFVLQPMAALWFTYAVEEE